MLPARNHTGRHVGDVEAGLEAQGVDLLAAPRRDGDADVLNGLFSFLRSDDDFFQHLGVNGCDAEQDDEQCAQRFQPVRVGEQIHTETITVAHLSSPTRNDMLNRTNNY